MNLENTQVQMRKGILEFCILIISRGEAYISNMLEKLIPTKITVGEGTLYSLFESLQVEVQTFLVEGISQYLGIVYSPA